MRNWFSFWRTRRESDRAYPRETPLSALRYVVLDTEFTSLDKRSNRLLSIGAVCMDGPRIRLGNEFYRVVDPGIVPPAHGVLIHRLRPADVAGCEPPGHALDDLRGFIEGAVLVGHFLRIDLDLLRKEMQASGGRLANPAIDTARVHRWLLTREPHTEDMAQRLETLDLASLTNLYHVDFEEAHHALGDAYATARLWQKMIHLLDKRNIRTLGKLLRIGAA